MRYPAVFIPKGNGRAPYSVRMCELLRRASHSVDGLMRPPVLSLVSATRQRITVLLAAYAALVLPAGDLIETGVYEGGTTVLMARLLQNLSSTRRLYACDSFQGLPPAQAEDAGGRCATLPGADVPRRRNCGRGRRGQYSTSRYVVEASLRREDLARRVIVVPGWFHQSLPPPGAGAFALLRLDGDTYNGTYEALARLYPRLVPGGAVYVDDYGSFKGAGAAVDRYVTELAPARRPTIAAVREPEGYYDAVWWLKPDAAHPFSPRGEGAAERACLRQLLGAARCRK